MATKLNKWYGMEPKYQELNVSVDAASLLMISLRVVWHGMESLWYGMESLWYGISYAVFKTLTFPLC